MEGSSPLVGEGEGAGGVGGEVWVAGDGEESVVVGAVVGGA